jgi:hypothetical protein
LQGCVRVRARGPAQVVAHAFMTDAAATASPSPTAFLPTHCPTTPPCLFNLCRPGHRHRHQRAGPGLRQALPGGGHPRRLPPSHPGCNPRRPAALCTEVGAGAAWRWGVGGGQQHFARRCALTLYIWLRVWGGGHEGRQHSGHLHGCFAATVASTAKTTTAATASAAGTSCAPPGPSLLPCCTKWTRGTCRCTPTPTAAVGPRRQTSCWRGRAL